MIKKVTKVGNSRGIIFDSALLQLARLKEGDELNVEVHAGGTITLTPVKAKVIDADEAEALAEQIISENEELFRRLS